MASIHAQKTMNRKDYWNIGSRGTTPQDVVSTFNTWQFKREQPDNVEELIKTTAHAIDQGLPIPFVLYWGKGRRDGVDVPELQCLDYLTKLTDKITDVYKPGAVITLILTDTHAELNGYTQKSISQYFMEMEREAHSRDISTVLLSTITRSHVVPSTPCGAQTLPPDQLSELVRSAEKWYRGAGSPEHGAISYYHANMAERIAVQNAYPAAIFITFNGRSHRFLLPERLPVFYMYSIRKGVAVKPWFIDAQVTDE